MDGKVLEMLQEYEDQVSAGKIKHFTARVQGNGLLIDTGTKENQKLLLVSSELLNSLKIFFFDAEEIAYPSFDYTTLKSLINAHVCIDRIKNKSS